MKKYTVYGLGLILLSLISCTRSAGNKNGANVVIKIPSSNELQAKTQNFSPNNYVNKLIQRNSLQTMNTSTGFDGALPLNCFAVIVAGPTEALQKNHCYKKPANPGVAVSFRAGFLSPIVSAGKNIELIDLDSGPDRVFRIVGFHSLSGDCPALASSQDNYGNGYLLAEAGGVNLEAGASISIPMKMSYDADKYVDHCEGPDFPQDSGGGDGGSKNSATRLAVKKDYFPVNQLVENICQSVDVVGKRDVDNFASVKSPVTFNLLGNGAVMSTYNSYDDCFSGYFSITEVTMVAGQDRKQIWFRSPYKATTPVLDIGVSFISNPDGLLVVPLTGIQVRNSYEKSFEIYAPNRILAGSCYKIKLEAKTMDNLNYPNTLSPDPTIAVENGAAFSDSSCNTPLSSVSFVSGKSSSSIYIRTSGLFGSKVKVKANHSGYVEGEKVIEVGTGGSSLANIEVRYNNQTMLGNCEKATVTFLNGNYTAINLPAALSLNMSASDTVASFFNDPCNTSNGGVMSVPAQSSSVDFYFSPLANGAQSIQLTIPGLPTYNLNYFAKAGQFGGSSD